MRIMVILLGIFGGMVIVEQAFVPLRVSQLSAAGMNLTIAGSILLFVFWTVATALVFRYPSVSVWLYSIGGVIGLYAGITESFRSLVTWGVAANLLALLCTLARREKRLVDLRRWEREKQITDLLNAVQAIRLAETPPVMLPVEWQPEVAVTAHRLPAVSAEAAPARGVPESIGHAGLPLRRDRPAIQVVSP